MPDCIAIIRGIPHIPSITEINVRTGPGTNFELAFKVAIGTDNLSILDIQPDAENKAKDGKVYLWFKLSFQGGTVGWVRDDLIDLVGDCAKHGYGNYTQKTFAFPVTRQPVSPAPSPSPAPATPTTPPVNTSPSPSPAPATPTTPPVNTSPSPSPAPATPATPPVNTAPSPSPAPATPATPPVNTAPSPSPAPATPTTPPVATAPSPSPAHPAPAPSEPAPKPLDSSALDRVRRAAFAITQAFEGKGYPAYQNYDSGIVSYGRFQFTLAAGSLGTVVQRFVERSQSAVANELRNAYLGRIIGRDANLRSDNRLKELLIAAAEDDIMKRVQNEVATEGYWTRMLTISANPRGIVMPLSLALLFDMAINFGVMHGLVTASETELGVPSKSKVGENGITEKQLITKLAELRKRSHDRQADRDNLPGLKVRGDFWVNLVASGDWDMQGDANGNINVKGRPLQVRTPPEL